MKILIIAEGYFPGKKYGGPPVSVKNFCQLMSEYNFNIITKNHDMGEKKIYDKIGNGVIKKENCTITYLSDQKYNIKSFEKKIIEIQPDLIYLQGLFQSCIIPMLILAKKYSINVLLAPRGELCSGAFKKKYKKIPYILLLKILGLLKNVNYQATSDDEYMAIRKILKPQKNKIYKLCNVPTTSTCQIEKEKKKKKTAKIIFLSRIVEKKNLYFALECLKEIKGEVTFDIYGPIEDENYWNKCQELIYTLPQNIKVNYKGIVSHDKIATIFNKYHAFLFPTFSENYGHVIVESLTAGCPIIISDQTPFSDINKKVSNSSISLNNKQQYIEQIQNIVNYSNEDWKKISKASYEYIKIKLNISKIKTEYIKALNSIKNGR